MVVIGEITFFKAVVVKIDVFCSQIVDERHFSTMREARNFSDEVQKNGYVCIVCEM